MINDCGMHVCISLSRIRARITPAKDPLLPRTQSCLYPLASLIKAYGGATRKQQEQADLGDGADRKKGKKANRPASDSGKRKVRSDDDEKAKKKKDCIREQTRGRRATELIR